MVNRTSVLLVGLNSTLTQLQSDVTVVQANVSSVRDSINSTLRYPDCNGCSAYQSELERLTFDTTITVSAIVLRRLSSLFSSLLLILPPLNANSMVALINPVIPCTHWCVFSSYWFVFDKERFRPFAKHNRAETPVFLVCSWYSVCGRVVVDDVCWSRSRS